MFLLILPHGAWLADPPGMTILCATRFTEESTRAVNVAASLAVAKKEPVLLVHVLPGGLMGAFAQLGTVAEAALRSEATRLEARGVNVQTVLLHGKLELELARVCREKGVRLAVVGDTARKYRAVMATTIDRLIYALDVPMLVVRDERPFHDWAAGKTALRVMLALDTNSASMIARDWIGRLSEYGKVELTATRVWWPAEEYARRGLATEEGHLAVAKAVKAETEVMLQGLPPAVTKKVRLEIGVGHVADELTALANEEHADLLVVGTHRRKGLGRLLGVSHHAIETAPMSVACVPSPSAVPDMAVVPVWNTALAATDFTEAGNRAVTNALALLKESGTVHVVYVSPEPFSPEKEKALVQKVADVLPPGAESRGARLLVHVLHGDAATEISEAAQRMNVDVICMGAKEEPTGVVAAVISRAGKPVLVAPPLAS